MGKIICIIGKSSSGKDTIYKELLSDDELGLKGIVPYTTRIIRKDEIHGVNYFFINEDQLEEERKNGRVIEERNYKTEKGIWYYCTINDGQIDISKNNHILVIPPKAFKSLTDYYGSDNVIPVYIEVDDGDRLERALKRERSQKVPDYNELCRRFISDNKDFDTSILEEYNINNSYINNDLASCVQAIKGDILKLI